MVHAIIYSTIVLYGIYNFLTIYYGFMHKIRQHRKLGKWLPQVTLLEVVIIELAINLNGRHGVMDTFFRVHIILATTTLVAIFIQKIYDGYKRPRFHKMFSYVVTLLSAITITTGIMLVPRI